MDTNGKYIYKALADSRICRDFQSAFNAATSLPVTLRPVESWRLPLQGRTNENRFCSFMSLTGRSCAVCLHMQQRLARRARERAASITCVHGLTDTAVPVRLEDQVVGFLQTGQVFRSEPTLRQFGRTARLFSEWGMGVDKEVLKEAFFQTPVVPPKRYDSFVQLLTVFSEHLAMVGKQVLVQKANAEPTMIVRAKEFIRERHAENLRLGQVAGAVNASTFYFCKMFKKVTGINFTDYVAQVRVEKARNLLLNPDLRISEIAYAVGFQSLTHFNRVFKKVIGRCPSQYRLQVGS